MEISVIIPTYNSSKTIAECLQAVYDSDFNDFEVIVVDDFSNDNTISIIKKFKKVKLVRLKKNSGPAKARNIGAEHAQGKILFFIDSDVLIEKNAIREVHSSFKKKDTVAVIGMYAKEPANKGFFQEYMALWKYFTRTIPKPPKYFTFFIGSCGAIKRNVFNEFKGFSTKYKGADVEDYEFGYRLRQKYKIKSNPSIQGKHYNSPFLSCMQNYYKRTYQWFTIFMKRRKFDTGSASASRGISSIIAFITLLLLLVSVLYPFMLIISAFLLIAFITSNIKFYAFTLKEKGAWFMFKSIVISFVLYIIVAISVINSIIRYPFQNE